MQTLWWDVRQSGRMMRKNPGFTTVAVMVLALGIGANTAIFSVINAVLLRPLPYRDPQQLVMLNERNLKLGFPMFSVSPTNFNDWRSQSRSFEQMCAYTGFFFVLTGSGEPERIPGARVSAELFPMLGIQPMHGRLFLPEEDQPGRNLVVILSESLWRRRFGADREILGRGVTFNGQVYTVVGILPSSTYFPNWNTQAWAPIAFNEQELTQSRGGHYIGVIARLKDGVSAEQALAEMTGIAKQLQQQYPAIQANWDVVLRSLNDAVVGRVRPALSVLLGAVGFVLLIACGNVANLLLARATVRQREIAIQTALGASRWRVLRQLTVESLLLALTGAAAGVLLARWAVSTMHMIGPAMGLPRWQEVSIDWKVLLFTLGISVLTAVIFAVAPAFHVMRVDVYDALKEGGRLTGGSMRRRLRGALVAVEVALSLILLIGAGLFIRSFAALRSVDLGLKPENVLTFRVLLPQTKYPDAARQAGLYTQALERMKTLPGVDSAALVSILPFGGQDEMYSFYAETMGVITPDQQPSAQYQLVSSDYFRTMGIPLLAGRAFSEQDVEGKPRVAIINDVIAERYFKDVNPIGKRIQLGRRFSIVREVVGVVGSAKRYDPADQAALQVYEPYTQMPQASMNFVLRTSVSPASLSNLARERVWSLDRDLPVNDLLPMDEVVTGSMAQPRFRTVLLGIFAGVALLLAAVGLYGVMAYSVAQRTHEIGLRMALGAQAGDVVRLVIRQGMTMTLIGIVMGVAGALALLRVISTVMSDLLFGIKPTDPATFVVIPMVLFLVSLVACFVPARRATRVDPLRALHHD